MSEGLDMIMKVELTPEVQAGLLAQARETGLTLEKYAEKVLRERAAHPSEATISVPQKEGGPSIVSSDLPIWDVLADLMKDVPDDVFERLPKDAASQVDHYIYGTPKRDQ